METAGSSKTSVHINHIALCHINEESYSQTVKQTHLRYLLYCPVQKTKGHHGQNNLRCSLSICCKTSCHLKMCRNSPKKTTSYSLHRVTYDFLKICLVCICFVASSTKREKVLSKYNYSNAIRLSHVQSCVT